MKNIKKLLNSMRPNLKYMLPAIICVIFSLLVLCSMLYTYAKAKAWLPNVIAVRLEENSLEYYHIGRAKRAAKPITDFTQDAIINTKISSGTQNAEINLHLTDQEYTNYVPLKLKEGVWFDSIFDNRQIVITEELAEQLFPKGEYVYIEEDDILIYEKLIFSSKDYLGKSIFLDGKEYIVCGVLKSPQSYMYKSSGNGLLDAYINFTAYPNYETVPVNTIYIENKNAFPQTSVDKFAEALATPFNVESWTDFEAMSLLMRQLFELVLFIPLMLACFLCIVSVLNSIIKGRKREVMRITGARELAVVSTVIFLLLAVMFLLLAMFKPVIPPYIAPQDNIFNYSHYKSYAVAAQTSANIAENFNFHRILLHKLMLLLWKKAIILLVASVISVVAVKVCGGIVLKKNTDIFFKNAKILEKQMFAAGEKTIFAKSKKEEKTKNAR